MPTELHRRNSTGVIHSGDDLPAHAISRAVLLAAAVHDEGPDEVAAILRRLNRQDIVEIAIALAAMVPVDYTPAELLAWNDTRHSRRRNTSRGRVVDDQAPLFPVVVAADGAPLKPHGTHAAFARHKKRGEAPCEACEHGERQYQTLRKRRQRQNAANAAKRADEAAS